MKRSLRRWQQRVARAHRVRILIAYGYYRPCWYRPDVYRYEQHPNKRLQIMTEPSGEWNRTMHIRPARIRSNQLERLIELGRDPDSLNFPSYRRPHVYYW